MNDTIQMKSTGEVLNTCEDLKSQIGKLNVIIDDTQADLVSLRQAWDGDTKDIDDVTGSLYSDMQTLDNSLIPCTAKIHDGAYYLATAIEKGSSGDISGTPDGIQAAEGDSTKDSGSESKPKGWWAKHGEDFADDWDFSNVHGALSGMGAVVSGVLGTIGSTANFICDGVGKIISFLYN